MARRTSCCGTASSGAFGGTAHGLFFFVLPNLLIFGISSLLLPMLLNFYYAFHQRHSSFPAGSTIRRRAEFREPVRLRTKFSRPE